MLFTVEDILERCEIWQKKYAYNILRILSEVFDDVEVEDVVMFADEEEIVSHATEWDEIRDDSSMLTFMDISEMEGDSEDSLEQPSLVSGANTTLSHQSLIIVNLNSNY